MLRNAWKDTQFSIGNVITENVLFLNTFRKYLLSLGIYSSIQKSANENRFLAF